MPSHNLSSLRDVESYFLTRVRALAARRSRTLTIWDDPVGEGVVVHADVALQARDARTLTTRSTVPACVWNLHTHTFYRRFVYWALGRCGTRACHS